MRSDGHCFSDLSGTCVAATQAVTITSGMQSSLATVDLVVVGEVATSWTLDGLVPDNRIAPPCTPRRYTCHSVRGRGLP